MNRPGIEIPVRCPNIKSDTQHTPHRMGYPNRNCIQHMSHDMPDNPPGLMSIKYTIISVNIKKKTGNRICFQPSIG
jgi:peptide methionine sulfoxide reductase MsrB